MKAQEFIIEGLRDPKDNPCWKGYKPVGTKQKGGRTVPNCVPKEGIEEQADWREASAKSNLQPGVPVMIWLGPRNQNPPRDDKKWWEKGLVMDSPEWIDGQWRVLVKTDTKSQWPINPERVFVLKKDVAEGATELDNEIRQLKQEIRRLYNKWHTDGTLTGEIKQLQSRLEKLQMQKKQGVAEGSKEDFEAWKKTIAPRATQSAVQQAKNVVGQKQAFAKKTTQDHLKKVASQQGLDEDYNAEYDDEAGMADNNLETLERAIQGIDDLIHPGDNLPEWCQEKIAVAKSMLVNVWDYMRSEEDRGAVAEDWQKANRKDKTPGMSKKAVAAYRRENPGSKLQTAVTTKPSKLKKGSKASKRRKSYCARSKGQMDMHNIDCSKTPDKAICKSRRRWNCE